MSGKKEEFFKVLNDSRTTLSHVEKLGKQVAQDARFLRDVAECVESVIDGLPSEDTLLPEHWDNLIGTWEEVRNRSKFLENLDTHVSSFSAVANTTGSTTTSVFQIVGVSPVCDQVVFRKPIEQFYRLLDKDALAAEVKSLIVQFGLNARSGLIRSPLELFEDGIAALQSPSASDDSPIAIMIPLRQCIDLIIDRLLKGRPRQESTGKRQAKICSIGAQCGRDELPSDHFRRLGSDADLLQNQFSKKDAALPRQESIELFERGTLFIKALLTSIDEKKLKCWSRFA